MGRVTCVFNRKRIQLLGVFHRNPGPDIVPCVGFLGPQRLGGMFCGLAGTGGREGSRGAGEC